ncbi:TraB/GumN family protein [Stenotrophomonas aracearum]|uniref:TraB/GumN family protein n=1 Tax=Stenotrophomonas aracearum TaxID=3003272 RepID=A0ABY9YK90_9GAMM|nr:TraB/GumN family protein [Stenotrophomonas sp. A5588]WNH50684.1 TraB/GumN family protein [Stenotrophomonas sp. A5588]
MMLKRLAAPLLLATGLLLGTAASAEPATPPAASTAPVPLLWKVTGPGDSRLYLLGSFHLLRAEDYPLAADVDQAFAASKRVVFELSPQDMQSPDLTRKMLQAAMRTDGSELKRDLDAATWTKLQKYAADNKLPLAQLQGMKPWFVGLTITLSQFTKMGLDPELGLDRHFMARAADAGKPTSGLEDIDTQVAVLSGMSLQEQQQMVAEALDQADQADAEGRKLHDAWRRGDDKLLWTSMAAEMRGEYPQLYKRINTDCNDAWVPKLEQQLKAGQGGTLVVVGTLHLLGEDGVVEKLRARGYQVERVCSGCAKPKTKR